MRRVKSPEVSGKAWADYVLVFVAAFALGIGWFARVYKLGLPPRLIWDEIYFLLWASSSSPAASQSLETHPSGGGLCRPYSVAPWSLSERFSVGTTSKRGSGPCCWPPSSLARRC